MNRTARKLKCGLCGAARRWLVGQRRSGEPGSDNTAPRSTGKNGVPTRQRADQAARRTGSVPTRQR